MGRATCRADCSNFRARKMNEILSEANLRARAAAPWPSVEMMQSDLKAMNADDDVRLPKDTRRAPSPLNGERAGVRGEKFSWRGHFKTLTAQWPGRIFAPGLWETNR